jgi:hypothetical protein
MRDGEGENCVDVDGGISTEGVILSRPSLAHTTFRSRTQDDE